MDVPLPLGVSSTVTGTTLGAVSHFYVTLLLLYLYRVMQFAVVGLKASAIILFVSGNTLIKYQA